MKIYVASSWRNSLQPSVVEALRDAGHDVYDFRNPAPGDNGFSWREVDPSGLRTPEAYLRFIGHERCDAGFKLDMDALMWCDTCVLVLPCGRSAHLELGYAVGAGKRTAVLIANEGFEPELMYKMCSLLTRSLDEVIEWLRSEKERSAAE